MRSRFPLLVGMLLLLASCSLLSVYGDTVLNFPRATFVQGQFTGFAIANPNDRDAEVTLTAYRSDASVFSSSGLIADYKQSWRIALLLGAINDVVEHFCAADKVFCRRLHLKQCTKCRKQSVKVEPGQVLLRILLERRYSYGVTGASASISPAKLTNLTSIPS